MKSVTSSHPVILLVSAPSGAGKTTLCDRLLKDCPELKYSVSVTTRQPREGEIDGVHYEFTDPETFMKRVGNGEFLEYAEVHGNLYGTSWQRVEQTLEQGLSVLMDVDVQGARLIRQAMEANEKGRSMKPYFHDVFISAPDMTVLRHRLETRGKDNQDVIERRLKNALDELKDIPKYECHIVNDQLDRSFQELKQFYLKSCQKKAP